VRGERSSVITVTSPAIWRVTVISRQKGEVVVEGVVVTVEDVAVVIMVVEEDMVVEVMETGAAMVAVGQELVITVVSLATFRKIVPILAQGDMEVVVVAMAERMIDLATLVENEVISPETAQFKAVGVEEKVVVVEEIVAV